MKTILKILSVSLLILISFFAESQETFPINAIIRIIDRQRFDIYSGKDKLDFMQNFPNCELYNTIKIISQFDIQLVIPAF